MYLVDTSVWIDYLRGAKSKAALKLDQLLEDAEPFGITSVIYQEVLQGTDSDAAFSRIEAYLGTQRFFHPANERASYAEAARLYARGRRKGITIRSTIDCLIARIAIENEVAILHSDRDFDRLARVAPELRIA